MGRGDGIIPAATPELSLLWTAVLDALGLLDDKAAALFDRSFHAAPEALRLRIIELQAAIAADPAFIASEQPAPSLRGASVAAVMAEVDRTESELAPLAIIGRETFESPSSRRRAAFSASVFWRAASLALAASLITTFVFMAQALESNAQLREALDRETWRSDVAQPDLPRGALASAKTFRTLRSIDDGAPNAAAVVALDLERGSVSVYGFGLERAAEYRVQVLDGDRVMYEQALAFSGGGLRGAMIACAERDRPRLAAATYRIVDDRGQVLLA